MGQTIGHVAVVVREYDEAIRFWVDKVGFTLIEDTPIPEQRKRWVLVGPAGNQGPALLLARASTRDQESRIGNQTGGRVFLFVHTDDFWRDYSGMRERGVEFVRGPEEHDYGTVAVFRDLYGNLIDLLQPVLQVG